MTKAIERIVSAFAVLIAVLALSACSGGNDDGDVHMTMPGIVNDQDGGSDGGDAGAAGVNGGSGNSHGGSSGNSSDGGSGSSGASQGGVGGNDPDSGSHGGQDNNPEGGAGGSGDGDGGDGDPDPDGGSPGDGDGDSGTGGTGGTGGDGGGDGDASPPDPEPFNPGTPVEDTTFPSGRGITKYAYATGPNHIFVPTLTLPTVVQANPYTTEIMYKDSSGWTPELAGIYAWCNEVAGAGGDVYAVCVKLDNSFYRSVILKRNGADDWTEVKLFGINEVDATSMWCQAADDCFAVIQYCDDATHCYPTVWRGSGTSWSSMTVPSALNGAVNRVRCFSGGCYAVGGVSSSAFLWQLDGAVWETVATLPSDVTGLADIAEADGELTVVGVATGGVRLSTSNLVNWARNDSAVTATDNVVFTPRLGAALIGGSVADQFGNQGPGDARLGKRSMGTFGPEASIDSDAMVVTSITRLSNTSAFITAYGKPSEKKARVYTVSY